MQILDLCAESLSQPHVFACSHHIFPVPQYLYLFILSIQTTMHTSPSYRSGTVTNSQITTSQGYPAMTTTTTTSTATYTSNQRYQPAGATPVPNFSYGIPTIYNPAQVPTFEAPVVVNIPVSRYRNWWAEATTGERKYVA